jgi:hypothetical protein
MAESLSVFKYSGRKLLQAVEVIKLVLNKSLM